MAAPNPRIRNIDVTPPVHAQPFAESPDSCFGIFALGRGMRANPLYTAYLELRTRVYTTQTGMLAVDALPYRLDIDDDDDRSFAFVVVKNTFPKPVAVACVRVIERLGSDNRLLPTEAFYSLDIGAGSVEVSRYIGRLDDAQEQAQALSELLRSTIAYIRQIGADDGVYAIVERPLERVLRMMGVGVARIAEPVWLEEYQGVNLALQLDPVVSAASLGGLSEIDELDVSEGAVRFWGTVKR